MAEDQTLRIVQVTDCHLFAEPDGKLLGMETRDSLNRVLELVAQEHPNPDLILATGDLSQDGSEASYQVLKQKLEEFAAPSYWFPGNHDRPDAMRAVLGEGASQLTRVVRSDHWQLILLDSTIPGKVPGRLEQSELDFLRQCLQERPDLHSLVSFHHQPVPIHCKWLDPLGIKNAEALFEVLDAFSNVRVVLWGHIHQQFEKERNGVQLLATPSTCVQFAPESTDFQVDSEPPGYRWLELRPDGSIRTEVSRVTGIQFEVDYTVKGY